MKICYVVSNGLAARMVLHTPLVPELRRLGAQVSIISPNADEEHFRAVCRDAGAEPVAAPHLKARWLAAYEPLRRYLLEDYRSNAALRARDGQDWLKSRGHPVSSVRLVVGRLLNGVARRSKAVRLALRRMETATLRSAAARRLLSEMQPDLLVATYPVNWLEAALVREGQRLGIRTAAQLLSWDNITCKGVFPAVPDVFVTWGPIMSEELIQHYDLPRSRIAECGVAHFDLHYEAQAACVSHPVFAELGLEERTPFLLFGLSARVFAPCELDVVAWLAGRVEGNVFGPRTKLVVRPHPQMLRGAMADPGVLARLEGLRSQRVVVDSPRIRSDRLPWEPDKADLGRLAALLAACSVCLNSGSTLMIDAVIHDKPVILPMFDGEADLPWSTSVRRILEYPHVSKALSFGGVSVVHDFDTLQSELLAYLNDARRRGAERARLCDAETGPRDGQASRRIAAALVRFAEAAHARPGPALA